MRRLAIIGLLVAGLGLVAQAAQIGTGLDASGNLLAQGAPEQNYTVNYLGSTATGPGSFVGAGVYNYGSPWVANVPNGQWISPVNPPPLSSGYSQLSPGYWGYTYNGTLSGFSSISGQFSSDNPSELLVNGVKVAETAGWATLADTHDYESWVSFNAALNSSGPNTIEFIVYNIGGVSPPGNPTGLIVEGTAVPDGGLTGMLLGLGMVGLGAIRRKLS